MRAPFKPATLTLLLGACSAAALAIGLGDPTLESTLGQPLRARVPLLLQPGEAATSGCVRAGPPTRTDAGEYALQSPRAELLKDGREILVTTRDPVSAPAIAFSLHADCGGQGVSRDYTLLPEPAAAQTPAPVVPRRASSAPGAGPGTPWELRPGESVRAIAGAIYPDAPGMQRRLVAAIVAASPGAFPDGDPDRAEPGTLFVIPDLRTIGVPEDGVKHRRPTQRKATAPPRAAPPLPDETAIPDRALVPVSEYAGLLQRIGGLEVVLGEMRRMVSDIPSPAAAPGSAPARGAEPADTGRAGVLAAAAALLVLGAGGLFLYRRRRTSAAPTSVEAPIAEAAAPPPAPAKAPAEPEPSATLSGVDAALQEAQLSVARGYPERAFELLEQHIRAHPTETRTWMLFFAILRSQH
ncbi:MAG TPA: hypothetical protein VFP70_01740, partial [Burkholderiales bacterium]|nr:hypothetical protein [Burkholderiales bacterium]